MAATPPPSYTPAPEQHPVRNQRSTFSDRVDAFITWFVTAIGQVAALASNAYANAGDAYTSAANASASVVDAQAAAAASAASAGVQKFVAGINYTQGTAKWSPLDGLPYRLVGPDGVYNVDPKLDAGNWKCQVVGVSILDEGGNVVAVATSINLVGDLVTATAVGGAVSISVATPTAAQTGAPTVKDAWAMALAI